VSSPKPPRELYDIQLALCGHRYRWTRIPFPEYATITQFPDLEVVFSKGAAAWMKNMSWNFLTIGHDGRAWRPDGKLKHLVLDWCTEGDVRAGRIGYKINYDLPDGEAGASIHWLHDELLMLWPRKEKRTRLIFDEQQDKLNVPIPESAHTRTVLRPITSRPKGWVKRLENPKVGDRYVSNIGERRINRLRTITGLVPGETTQQALVIYDIDGVEYRASLRSFREWAITHEVRLLTEKEKTG
jgi:hypothetical protein